MPGRVRNPSRGGVSVTLLLFFAFTGAEAVLTPSGEIRDPARTLPRAIFGATACFVLIYVALQIVSQGILGQDLAYRRGWELLVRYGFESRQYVRAWTAQGSRNREKSPGQHLLDEYAPHLVRKCIALAMQGDPSAMRMCMERISPARRGATIRMNLPPIRTAQDVDRAAEKVTQAIRRGDLTPAEGGTMMNILESRSRVIERGQWEGRLEKLEEKMAA